VETYGFFNLYEMTFTAESSLNRVKRPRMSCAKDSKVLRLSSRRPPPKKLGEEFRFVSSSERMPDAEALIDQVENRPEVLLQSSQEAFDGPLEELNSAELGHVRARTRGIQPSRADVHVSASVFDERLVGLVENIGQNVGFDHFHGATPKSFCAYCLIVQRQGAQTQG
jgi:hypothetical protein